VFDIDLFKKNSLFSVAIADIVKFSQYVKFSNIKVHGNGGVNFIFEKVFDSSQSEYSEYFSKFKARRDYADKKDGEVR
jgi:hypothetical protein